MYCTLCIGWNLLTFPVSSLGVAFWVRFSLACFIGTFISGLASDHTICRSTHGIAFAMLVKKA